MKIVQGDSKADFSGNLEEQRFKEEFDLLEKHRLERLRTERERARFLGVSCCP